MSSPAPIRRGWMSPTSTRCPSRAHRVAWVSALFLGMLGVTLSCGDAPPTDPGRLVLDLAPAAQPGRPVRCAPLADDSVTVTVGPAGGEIAVGREVLAVPKGALARTVGITALVRADTVNLVQFRPEGLVFARAATLTMYYGNCVAGGPGPRPRIALVDDRLQVREYVQPPRGKGPKPPYVAGKLMHFSNYAVAW